jgi:hypothetical protein
LNLSIKKCDSGFHQCSLIATKLSGGKGHLTCASLKKRYRPMEGPAAF